VAIVSRGGVIPLQTGLDADIQTFIETTLVPNAVEFATNAATFLLTVAIVYYAGKATLLPLTEEPSEREGPARRL